MKKAIKVIDFSKLTPNKFYGRSKAIIGAGRFAPQPNPSDKLFRFVNSRTGRFVDIRAADRKEARLIFLEGFNLAHMPVGFEFSEVGAAA